MQIKLEPEVRLSGSPAIAAFMYDFDKVASAYEYNWQEQESYRRRADYLAKNWGGDRAALAGALERFNKALGAGEATLANLRRLREPQTLAVVTGQQAGIFTGPTYTIFKAITAVRLARQQSERLGVPVVPVFWIAGEDHDFAEISWVMAPTNDGLVKVQVGDEPSARTSVGHLPLPASIAGTIDEMLGLVHDTEFKATVAERLKAAAQGAPAIPPYDGPKGGLPVLGQQTTYADWFGRLMTWLFEGTGLVILNPVDPDLRRLGTDFFVRAIERAEQVDEALQTGFDRWQALGFEPTVERQLGNLNLFTYVKGERLPLVGAGDHTWIRDREEIGWSRDELIERARRRPEFFSTNVVLRPVIQGALLPDLAYIGGPGEVSYFGLYRDVFAAMGQQMPVVYPRISATLVEPFLARYLEKQDLTLADVFYRLDEKREDLLEREDRLGLSNLFEQFRSEFDGRYEKLVETLLALDKSLSFVAEENRRQIGAQINKLEEKAQQHHRKNCEVGLRQFERLGAHLYPNGLQERMVSVVPYLIKYGPDLVGRLVEGLDVTEGWVHRSIWL